MPEGPRLRCAAEALALASRKLWEVPGPGPAAVGGGVDGRRAGRVGVPGEAGVWGNEVHRHVGLEAHSLPDWRPGLAAIGGQAEHPARGVQSRDEQPLPRAEELGRAERPHRPWAQVTRSTLAMAWAVTTHKVVPDAATACGWRPTRSPAPARRAVRGSMRSTLTWRACPAAVTQTTPGAAASSPDPFRIGEGPDAGRGDSSGVVVVTRSVRGLIWATAAPSDAQTAPSPTARSQILPGGSGKVRTE